MAYCRLPGHSAYGRNAQRGHGRNLPRRGVSWRAGQGEGPPPFGILALVFESAGLVTTYPAASSKAARLRATSSSVVDQLLTDTRSTAWLCQREPDIQAVPSASRARVTAAVRSP